ncbi:Major facilitator superfamily MFS_1 [Sulfurimonas denitrificans DSM 1251]|jgi:MFS family permease|uniref:Major facilitator superfamily MFS_1 n=1 Tax=Sulfurimonas denitrificans (strain ATCC 33889 / DSM 1251) TaxID=326298 RepID=Q30P28_SULDN|nr:MFS transporter [Sulfurimonas denitrificans]ABB45253.1 Major facilitator superfamily MFS_1 [Sulfurimonas denitrificans DSM 1251]MDD3442049.1 MFS transporter [Sulfurimonas denitrificans]
MDKFSSHVKNILHGFFLAIGTTIAEPSTILPLIVNYFGGSSMLVGFFASLLRGGAVMVQLFAAFHAQSYKLMMPYLRRIFFVRFFSWFFIGVSIIIFGENYPNITLFSIGLGLFIFSFSAGFAAIYFREIMAKIFTHKFRGKTMAYRQFFSALGGLLSGALAAWILESFEAPQSYGYLFVISSFIMALGYISFSLVEEPIKEEVSKKESSFGKFLKNSYVILKADKNFQIQVTTFLLAYGYLIALPFIILDAQQKIDLDGVAIGWLITTQMVGAMLSNFLWGNLSGRGKNVLTAKVAILAQILAITLAFSASSLYEYMLIFFLVGASMDGNRIASSNLILKIAPADKRPVYIALQMNIVSLGMFFSILGGVILHFFNYTLLYSLSLGVLFMALLFSLKLKETALEV